MGIRDWTALESKKVLAEEAGKILSIVNVKRMNIPLVDFIQGLEVELEHGTTFEDANVTNNHPVLTGMIVLAHLKETLDYYKRLDVVELEGDLLKAAKTEDGGKMLLVYMKWLEAKQTLANGEVKELG
jgi:hypothetical protein